MISVPFASGVLRRLGQRSRESFWSLFVELFQCLECPSLDRVNRLVSSTPDVVLCTVVQQFVRSCVSHMHDFTLVRVELHLPRLCPFHRRVEVSL